MKKTVGILILAVQAVLANPAASQVMDITVASDMAAVDVTQVQKKRGSLWSLGLARNEELDATTASLTFNVVGDLAAINSVQVRLGWKALYHNTFQSDYSLAVGGNVRYEPPTVAGLGFEGGAYLAPEVLSSGNTELYRELVARITYQLYPRATVYAGWTERKLEYNETAPVREVEIADGLMFGFSLAF